MNNAGNKKIILGLILMTGMLAVAQNGCSRFMNADSKPSTQDSFDADAPMKIEDEPDILVGARTLNVAYGKAIIDHYAACLGVAKPSDNTYSVHRQFMDSVSMNGKVREITRPMMMGVMSIVAAVCDDLIDQEISLGNRMFVGFNFSADSLPSESNLLDASARLSLSCWNRSPESIEKNTVRDMVIDSIGATEARGSRKAALMQCVTMLSATDGIIR